MPETLRNNPLSTQLSVFEEFWDAEVPRVGEDGATGWAVWQQSPPGELEQTVGYNLPTGAEDAAMRADVDPYRRWYENELRLDDQHNRPRRTTDQSDDPFATILFADIRDFLLVIHSDEGRLFLLHTFLAFLGLHIPDLAASFDHATSAGSDDDLAQPSDGWILPYSDRFLLRLFPQSKEMKSSTDDWEVLAGIVVPKEDTMSKSRATFGQIKEWPWKAIHPLEGTAPKGIGRLWEAVDVDGLDHAFIR